MLGTLGLIWGASFLSISLALRDFGPLTVAATRITLAAILLVTITFARGSGLPPLRSTVDGPKIWLCALIVALTSNAVPFVLLSWGQQSVASGFAGVCMSVVPLIILPLAHALVPGEQMNLRKLVGFVIGTAGVVVLIGPAAFVATGAEAEALARLACVGAAMCYAIGSITTRLCPQVDFYALAAAVMLLASVLLLPVALWVEGVPTPAGLLPLLALLYLGILPTAIAQIMLVKVIREAGPTFMGLVNYQVPVWSVVLGALILGEALPASLISALALILAGVALSQGGALARLFRAMSRSPTR